jgi:hypothetical protein
MDAYKKEEVSEWVVVTANSLSPATLISPIRNGTRKISAQLLSPSDSGYESVSPSTSTASAPADEGLEIPVSLYTAEGLQWCGFDKTTAQRIMDSFLESSTEVTLDEFVIHYLRTRELDGDTSWTNAMNSIGIVKELQSSILSPAFSDVRPTQSLLFWVEEFIISNILTMRMLNEHLTNKIKEMQQPRSSLRGGAGIDLARVEYDITRPGYDTLYRATTTERLKKVFLASGKVALENTMPYTAFSQPANDFGWGGYGTMFYWTKNDFVAQRYAEYYANCVKNKYAVVIIRLFGKQVYTQPPGKTCKMEYGDEWRQLLWHSRNEKAFPKTLRDKFLAHDVVIGPISINATALYQKMDKWDEVSYSNVFTVRPWGADGPVVEGSQHVFRFPDIMQGLNEKVDVDLFRCFPQVKYLPTPQQWIEGRLNKEE